MVQKVFISSTSEDLTEYRQVAIDTCLKLELFPIAMEHFEAMDADALAGSKNKLDQADLYIGIFAHRYGYVPPDYGQSITEMEYDYAREKKIPRLLFVIDPKASWPGNLVEHGIGSEKLEKFKQRIGKQSIVNFFRSPEDFQAKLALSLIRKINLGKDDEEIVKTKSREGEQIVIKSLFGAPSTGVQFKNDVFALMPFNEEFRLVYQEAVQPAVNDLSLVVKRGDDFFMNNVIILDIWSGLIGSRLVIADTTGRNTNVFYELGIAHTLGKPTIIITQDGNDIPFDLAQFRFVIYENSVIGLGLLREQLRSTIVKMLNDVDEE